MHREAPGPPTDGEVRSAGTQATALQLYLDSIRPIPVLPREEIAALAERRASCEAAFRAAMASIPATALGAVERWHERRAAGFVTGVLAAGYREERGKEGCSEQLDAAMQELERLWHERRALVESGALARERARVDRLLAERLAEADLSLDLYLSLFEDFVRLVSAPPDDATAGEERRRLSLHLSGVRARLARAQRALEGREQAVNSLLEHNLKLVVRFAKRYRGLGVPFLDLVQEGNLGLVRAAEKFDPGRGFSFSTYAVWWIEQGVIRAVQNHSRTVRVPAHVYDRQLRYRQAARELRQTQGREPTVAELTRALDLSPRDVELVVATTQRIRSTSEMVPGTEDITLEDTLTDDAPEDVVDGIDRAETRDALESAMRCLRPRERQILEWRFGLWDGESKTLEEIGTRIGLSRERVRQIQAAALARLRARAGVRGLAASVGRSIPKLETE